MQGKFTRGADGKPQFQASDIGALKQKAMSMMDGNDAAQFRRMMNMPLTSQVEASMRAMMKAAGMDAKDIDTFIEAMKAK